MWSFFESAQMFLSNNYHFWYNSTIPSIAFDAQQVSATLNFEEDLCNTECTTLLHVDHEIKKKNKKKKKKKKKTPI